MSSFIRFSSSGQRSVCEEQLSVNTSLPCLLLASDSTSIQAERLTRSLCPHRPLSSFGRQTHCVCVFECLCLCLRNCDCLCLRVCGPANTGCLPAAFLRMPRTESVFAGPANTGCLPNDGRKYRVLTNPSYVCIHTVNTAFLCLREVDPLFRGLLEVLPRLSSA